MESIFYAISRGLSRGFFEAYFDFIQQRAKWLKGEYSDDKTFRDSFDAAIDDKLRWQTNNDKAKGATPSEAKHQRNNLG